MSETVVVNDVVSGTCTEGLIENGKNRKTIQCQRCPSEILRPGDGTYEEKPFLLPHMSKKAEGDGGPNKGDVFNQYWSVDDIYKFENMGFSNTVGNTIKYLVCADCEMGPIGYHDINTKVSYVALQRVVHK